MKNELGGKIIFAALIPKTYSYLLEDVDENKKGKGTQKCVIKRKLKFEDYKHSLKATQLGNKINQLGKYKRDVDSF